MSVLMVWFMSMYSSWASTDVPLRVTPVAKVELERYLGTWYEIASNPQRFSRGCHCTRAVYSLRNSKTIRVYNTCNRGSVDGRLSEAKGRARIVNHENNAQLRVSFFLPWTRLFEGDYWIIALDSEYRYAVVSEPRGEALWILSRTPTLDSALKEEALAAIRAQGISTEHLQDQVQEGCRYP